MDKWEYQVKRDRMERKEKVIECGMEGECFVHEPIEDEFQKILNVEGSKGWELVHLGYHQGEILTIWKRKNE